MSWYHGIATLLCEGVSQLRATHRTNLPLLTCAIPYKHTLVFGERSLLLNNTARALRRFPVFPVFGEGKYPFHTYISDTWQPRHWRLAVNRATLLVTSPGRRYSPFRTAQPASFGSVKRYRRVPGEA